MKSVPIDAGGQEPRIGARLRDARQRQGLTIDQVAQSTGLTKGFISRIERDVTSPSVSTLVTVCAALSLPVGELFTAPKNDVVRAADAPKIQLTGHGADERLLTPRGQGRVQLIRSVTGPGATGGDELYTLNCEVEVVHVLRGTLQVRFSDSVVTLAEGDTLTFSGREPHSWLNPDETATSEALWVIAPASWST
ncbi:helix-turn-helix domain-containing protein [Actinoallomurus rhizosphaericola]|uniref:helix-turn-helix domain-containing protein n=1 Tax=Actinoallomurus rhizosphaericola TaxID=2952536 RepID=UPI002091DBAF|nr:helix-turn-helix domain-containing protein [Actinoallomurus rhizosphaericola]MCO5994272.1 helix-turn-helix domain-containing protein [Actinoallomurus rhizosphaericola]